MTAAVRDGGVGLAERAVKERPILFLGRLVRAILEGRKSVTRRVVKPQPWEDCGSIEVGSYHPTISDRDGEEAPGAEVFGAFTSDGAQGWRCPYGQPGDRLWVRESWTAALRNPKAFPGRDGWRWWHEVPPGMRGITNAHSLFYRADGVEVYVAPMIEAAKVDGEGFDLVRDWRHTTSDHPVPVPRWLPSIHMPRWASRISLEVTGISVERLQEISEEGARAEGAQTGSFVDPNDAPRTHVEAFHWTWDKLNAKRGHGWDANPWVWVIRFKPLPTNSRPSAVDRET